MKLIYCRSTAFKNNLTAEHAKTAEVISAAAQNKDIFSVLVLSGAASRFYGFLSALSDLCGEKSSINCSAENIKAI
jgi:hypothetical protein